MLAKEKAGDVKPPASMFAQENKPSSTSKRSLVGFDARDIGILPPSASRDADALARQGFSGPSRPLPYRRDMETLFGMDLGSIGAYTGPTARVANRHLRSDAYTMGNRIAFGTTAPDRALVAHEVAHVMQHARRPHAGKGVDRSGEAEADTAEKAARTSSSSGPNLFALAHPLGGASLRTQGPALRENLITFPSPTPTATPQGPEEASNEPTPEALIDESTNLLGLNLQEEALGQRLANLTLVKPNPTLIAGVLGKLGAGNAGQVAGAMIKDLQRREALEKIVRSPIGHQVIRTALGAVIGEDRAAEYFAARVVFPPPLTLPANARPLVYKGTDGTAQLASYQVGATVYNSFGKRIDAADSAEATTSPLDFVGGGGGAVRGGVALTGIAGRIAVQDSKTVIAQTFTRAAIPKLKDATTGILTSGVVGGGINVYNQIKELEAKGEYLSIEDIQKISIGRVAAEFIISAVIGAWVGRVQGTIKLPKQLISKQTVETLIRQQGVIAPIALIANLVRAPIHGKSVESAAYSTATDSLFSLFTNFVFQASLLGPVGNLIYGSAVQGTDRLQKPVAAILRATLAQARQEFARRLSGLT